MMFVLGCLIGMAFGLLIGFVWAMRTMEEVVRQMWRGLRIVLRVVIPMSECNGQGVMVAELTAMPERITPATSQTCKITTAWSKKMCGNGSTSACWGDVPK